MEGKKVVEIFLARHKWKALNVTQQKAVDQGILGSQENFLVIAPTGGGKTGVAELVMLQSLKHDPLRRVLYVAPLKTLVQANLDEFRTRLNDHKVMHVKERNALRDAEVLVAPNESAYRAMLEVPDMIRNFSVLVLDELHLMYQSSRGHTVEKILTLAKNLGMRLVSLSATVEDKDELRVWLNSVLIDIPETQRPIPLQAHDFKEKDFAESLLSFDKPPALIFRSTKKNAESTARRIAEAIRRLKGPESHFKLVDVRTEMQSRMNIDMTSRLEELALCISDGVAWHHSELPPGVRGYIEDLYSRRKIDYIAATTTLAYGFDSPTRMVVIYDWMRYSGDKKMEPIGVHEFRQMAGRAGRPSKSEFNDGFVCGVVATDADQEALRMYRTSKLEPVQSQIGTVDDYFQKAIMEFIHAGYNSVQEIADIMDGSFYRSKGSGSLGLYDPLAEIRRHLSELTNAEFVHALPGDRLRLSKVGEFIVGFQLARFESFDLRVFSELNEYVRRFPPAAPIQFHPQILYEIAKTTGTVLPKNRAAIPDEVEKAIASCGWKTEDPFARTAAAVFWGWMDLVAVGDIETRFGVQADAIEGVTQRLADNGLHAFIELARLNNCKLDRAFDTAIDAMRDGVPAELVPLTNIRDIGRKRAAGIARACDAIVTNTSLSVAYRDRPSGTPLLRRGKAFARKDERVTGRNCLTFLRRYLTMFGEDDVRSLLQLEPGIGPATAGKVVELLKGTSEVRVA